ncbi:ACP2 [Branchiostoma lanceolatum]|uniref:ACP2 protein n=1 Tax=Branchiostoma lanceolatum TaxID=7740 RepID=A0A8J9VCT9_BRALA|nr:ACP2 [Branchiostoma lanceolatum]
MADSRSISRVIYFLSVILSLILQIRGRRTLKFVSLVYRHGDRSPFNVYGNDTNTEDTWPQGFMQFSQVSMRQQFELGQFLRSRYVGSNFLNSSYSRYQVQVLSTDTDRTLMSAQANLAGLFPPAGDQVWNSDIPWQPIPVHTRPANDDVLLGMPPCPRHDYLTREFQRTDPEYLKMEKDNKDFFEYLALWTGLPEDKMHHCIWKLIDSLFCEKTQNRTFPAWATPEVYDKLTELTSFNPRTHSSDNHKARIRLRSGPLLGAMVRNMTQAKEGTLPDGRLRLVMYSAHDSTVAGLLLALGAFNHIHPPYCACVMVELYQEDSGNFFVEVWYRNDSAHDPYLLTVPGCPNPCSYQQFLKATKDSIVMDREKECQLSIFNRLKRWTSPMIGGVALMLLLIAIVLIWTYVRRTRRRRQHSQKLISEENISLTNDDEDDADDETL